MRNEMALKFMIAMTLLALSLVSFVLGLSVVKGGCS